MALALRSQASSSSFMSSSAQPSHRYDVFLSFRGEDTRKAFTDHLYKALKQEGIDTFRDDDAMERGRLLKPELTKAIHESAISLIVFSKNYASSEWCLDEVLMIMKQYERSSSKGDVVPVFYNIDPTEVRNQTGCFQEAFNGYVDIIEQETDVQKKRELLEKVKAWRGSLNKAGSLTGMVLREGYEAEFITNIVKDIKKKLNYNALYITGKLVGMKNDVATIESWLQDTSTDSTVLLIHGMGGIGKTTIATCIFNSNCREYDGSCFLANINEESNQEKGLIRLQTQLLSKILKSKKEEIIWNVNEGITKVMKAICSKKILLVLDDVTTSRQLDALLGPRKFHPGSKVIITTRDQSLLNEFEVRPRVQIMQTLCTQESSELFSLYAFHHNQPTEPYIIQSKLGIDHCMGHPLALKVLGSYLRGKTIKEWEDAMRKLESIPLTGIQKVLQLSYESLEDDSDKDLFLHIACFFVREDKDFIVKLLVECNLHPTVGIRNLMDRCLVYVTLGKVGMHQLIREMGRDVVRQESPKYPGKRTRLWRHEDCINVLQENEGTEKVEGLVLDMQNTVHGNEENFNIGALEKMKNLMLLQLDYATISGSCSNLPVKLRLLRWHGFPLKSIPCDIPMKKLVVLDMSYSKLKRVWDDYKSIGSLKFLNLSYCDDLMKTPNFNGLLGLESLILKGCKRLRKVDKSIACLNELVLLDITDCINLREFPLLPASLVSLEMSGCPNLGVVGGLRCLDSTSAPSCLMNLNISYCNLFDGSFPNDWSNLVSLKSLKINGNNITCLPKCIQSLPILQDLFVLDCSVIQSIQGFPDSIRCLYSHENKSLEKIQSSNIYLEILNCPKVWEVEGIFKWSSIDKVEMKIIEKMGLGSAIELDILDYSKLKVSYEYGIFSTWVRRNLIPCCSIYMYNEKGPQISFRVPENDSRSITSFNLCLVLLFGHMGLSFLGIQVYNKTKDLLLVYKHSFPTCRSGKIKKKGWVSLWRCGNLLDHGDEIFVRILLTDKGEGVNELYMGIEECGINLIYQEDTENIEERADDDDDDDDDDDMERKEGNNEVMMSASDEIAWSDRMFVEISDFVHNGETYEFGGFRKNCNWYSGRCHAAEEHEEPRREGTCLFWADE